MWRDLSVSKKLYAVVGVLALLIATELLTLLFAMDVLSAVRSFVGGESLWSKGQKDAAYSLHRYAKTGNEKFYDEFLHNLEIPHGDHEARVALAEPVFIEQRATSGFLRGGINPEDIPGLIKLIRRFHAVPHIQRALEVWNAADDGIVQLEAAGKRLKAAIVSNGIGSDEIEIALSDIDRINERLTQLEVDFSSILGEGSRWLEGLLMAILVCVVLTVESTGLFLTISFGRTLNRSLKQLARTADEVGRGNFTVRAPVHSGDELGQLAISINKMTSDLGKSAEARDHAENASQSKSQFLANMSHEIRTPLGVIIGLAEILRDPKLTRAELVRYVDTIERTGKNLNRIINDILDLSKVEADKLEIENAKFSVREFMQELQTMLSVQADRTGNVLMVATEGALPKQIVTDRTRVRQVLVNLVNNALKYTSNGKVELTASMDGRQLVFEISDNGGGISPENQARLFEAFTRESGQTAEGTGLGLMIAKRLAQAMGGDVVLVESEVGKGSRFRADIRPAEVFLDAAAGATAFTHGEFPAVSATTKDDADDLTGRRVLVVEDSEDNQLLVKLLLMKKGMHVDFANNGLEAVETAPNGNYDFVLMDMQMPIMDGYAATRNLRNLGFAGPILALTAHAMKEDRDRCLSAGCDEYLTKPIDSKSLFATMSRLQEGHA